MSGVGEVKPTKGCAPGPWCSNRNIQQIRVPNINPETALLGRYDGNELNRDDHPRRQRQRAIEEVARRSTLNANAPEFVPQAQILPNQEDVMYLKEAIEVLTLNPGRYDEFLAPILDIAESIQNNTLAVARFIDIVLEQCISEGNFRYTGAKILNACRLHCGYGFTSCILNRCCERNDEMGTLLEVDRPRVNSFVMLLAELYSQLTLDEVGTRIAVLGRGLIALMNELLRRPYIDSMKTVCQVLKLCGKDLRIPGLDVETVYSSLNTLKNIPEFQSLEPLINVVLRNREAEFQQIPPPPPLINEISYLAEQPVYPQRDAYYDPVFYGPDGAEITEEESSFLSENIPLSEDRDDYILDSDEQPDLMTDEMSAAFDEFVSFSESKRRMEDKNASSSNFH